MCHVSIRHNVMESCSLDRLAIMRKYMYKRGDLSNFIIICQLCIYQCGSYIRANLSYIRANLKALLLIYGKILWLNIRGTKATRVDLSTLH